MGRVFGAQRGPKMKIRMRKGSEYKVVGADTAKSARFSQPSLFGRPNMFYELRSTQCRPGHEGVVDPIKINLKNEGSTYESTTLLKNLAYSVDRIQAIDRLCQQQRKIKKKIGKKK